MQAFLLLWNPKIYFWDKYDQDLARVARGQPVVVKWSTGHRRTLPAGSRIYLLKLGPRPRGLAACGTSVSEVKETEDGLTVRFRIETMFPREGPLPRADLERVAPTVNWHPQGGGVAINDASIRRLIDALIKRFESSQRSTVSLSDVSAFEGLAAEARQMRRKRNRGLRDEALRRASGVCACCGQDFTQILQGRGIRALQVHHRRPLGQREGDEITTLRDLAVVCATCHTLLHVGPKGPMPVAQLRRLLRRRSRASQKRRR